MPFRGSRSGVSSVSLAQLQQSAAISGQVPVWTASGWKAGDVIPAYNSVTYGGAAPDNTGDQIAAINGTIADAGALGQPVAVVIPPGKFKISSPPKIQKQCVWLYGCGVGDFQSQGSILNLSSSFVGTQ